MNLGVFQHRGLTFEEHGPACTCESCAKTKWDEGIRAVVWMRDEESGYYKVYRVSKQTREDAADWIISRYHLT